MGELGQIINSHTIRFERILPGPVDKLWEYLTQPQGIGAWLDAKAVVEQRVGGRVELRFDHEDPDTRHLYAVRGVVSECSRPTVLAYSWFETSVDLTSKVRFELHERGDQVVLIITHSHVSPEFMPKVGAGWHAHLSVLLTVLRGEQPGDFMITYEDLFRKYSALVATSVVVSTTVSPAVASPSDPAYRMLRNQRQELLQKYDKAWNEADQLRYEINQLKRDTKLDTTRGQNDLERELQYKSDDLHRIEIDIHDLDKAMI